MKNIILRVIFASLCFFGTATAAYATEIIQLTQNDYDDTEPAVNDKGHVVWAGNLGDIFFYDGTGVSQIGDNPYPQEYQVIMPRVNNSDCIVWGRSDGNDPEIYLYDGSSVTQLTDNTYNDYKPVINDNGYIVWEGGDGHDDEIFLYNGSSVSQITDNLWQDYDSDINDSGQIVWMSGVGNDNDPFYFGPFEICYYDGSSNIQLTDSEYSQARPHINQAGHVSWAGGGGPGPRYSIYLYNGSGTTEIVNASGWGGMPQINDMSNVVWQGDSEIFLYNGTDVDQITDNRYYDGLPYISNKGSIAWSGYDGHDYEVFFYNGTEVIQITDNLYNDSVSMISKNGKYIVWRGYDGNDDEIFLAKLDTLPLAYIDQINPNPVTEGDSVILSGHGEDQDGNIVEYNWSSSIDGYLGNESIMTISSLSVGVHTISFTVKDDTDVWSDEVSQTLKVNAKPIAAIDSIKPNPATQGEVVTLTGHGEDQDGNIAAYTWRSSIDGALGAAATLSVSTLSVGDHAIIFRVKDNDDVWSAEVSQSLKVKLPIPAPPEGLAATSLSSSQIKLTWQDKSDNEAGFKIERSLDGITFGQIGTISVDTTSYADTSLKSGTDYYYRVCAYNSAGSSGYSNIAAATTAYEIYIYVIRPENNEHTDYLNIFGKNFGQKRASSKVQFESQSNGSLSYAEIVSWSNSHILCQAPAIPAGLYNVRVIKDSGKSNKKTYEVIAKPPVLTWLWPSWGTKGSSIAIHGKYFGQRDAESQVNIYDGAESKYAEIVSWRDGEVVFKVPAMAKRNKLYKVKVHTKAGWSNNLYFFYK